MFAFIVYSRSIKLSFPDFREWVCYWKCGKPLTRFSIRDAVDMLNALYNQVDEEVHKLVILSNKSQKELDSLLEVRKFEEQSEQVGSPPSSACPRRLSALDSSPSVVSQLQIKLWFSCEGEKQLVPLDSLDLSVDKIKELRESLELFLEESVVSSSGDGGGRVLSATQVLRCLSSMWLSSDRRSRGSACSWSKSPRSRCLASSSSTSSNTWAPSSVGWRAGRTSWTSSSTSTSSMTQ